MKVSRILKVLVPVFSLVLVASVAVPRTCFAKKTLVVYELDGFEAYLDKLAPIFEKANDCKVQRYTSGTGALVNKLMIEKDKPVASVALLMPPFLIPAKNQGLLARYVPKESSTVPAAFKDPHGYWTGWLFGPSCFIYNPALLPKPPETYEDLLDPKYKGKIAYSSPVTAGDGNLFLIQAIYSLGEKEAFEFMKKLEPSVKFHTKGTGFLDVLCSKGEILAANGDLPMDLMDKLANGMSIEPFFIRPKKGEERVAMPFYCSVSVVKGAPEPELAKKFADLLLSKEGQEALALVYGVPTRTDVKVDDPKIKQAQSYVKDVKILKVNWAEVDKKREEWVSNWSKDVLGISGKRTGVTSENISE
jgi:2-aminoethylphosphonate transport system substrate-binding protein